MLDSDATISFEVFTLIGLAQAGMLLALFIAARF